MKIIKNFLFVIIVSIAWLCNTNAYGTENMKPCAPGCFCVNNGQMRAGDNPRNICGYGVAQRVPCFDTSIGHAFGIEEGKAWGGLLECSRDSPRQATYYYDEFSEVFVSSTGMYGFIGDDLIVMPSHDVALNYWGEQGIYQCPSHYPNSAAGAKTLKECYKYDKNGNKVYYKKPIGNLETINPLFESPKQTEDEFVQANSDIDIAKKMIDSGITSSPQMQKQVSKSTLSKSTTRGKK